MQRVEGGICQSQRTTLYDMVKCYYTQQEKKEKLLFLNLQKNFICKSQLGNLGSPADLPCETTKLLIFSNSSADKATTLLV